MVTEENQNHFATFELQEDGEVWQSQSRRHCKLPRRLKSPKWRTESCMNTHVLVAAHTLGWGSPITCKCWRSILGRGRSEALPQLCRWSNKARKAASFGGNLGLCLLIFQALLTMNTTVSRWQFWTKTSLPNVVINKQWTVIAFLYLHQSLNLWSMIKMEFQSNRANWVMTVFKFWN